MILMWLCSLLIFGCFDIYMLFLVACVGSCGFKSKRGIFLAIPDPTCRFWQPLRIRAVVFCIFCNLWILERHDSCVVAFLIEFQSFQYIIC